MKPVFRLLSLLVLTAALAALTGTACQKATPERAWDRGAFRRVAANEKSYTLPSGVSVDTIASYEEDWPSAWLPLFMLVSNSQTSDVEVKLPAGLVFAPPDSEYQHMMLLQEYTFTAAAGANHDTVIVSTFQCNDDLSEPDVDSYYSIGWVQWDKEIQELLDTLAGKTAPVTGEENLDLVQQALSEITEDSTGLTDSTRTRLASLP